MTMSGPELTTWRDDAAARRDAAAALVAAEQARDPGGAMQEQDWLAQAVTAVAAGGTHPAQFTGTPTSGGTMSIPPTPPRSWSR